jgi:hypothetical protein
MVPMGPWFVSARAMYLQAGVDKYIGGWLGDFDNLQSLSGAEMIGGFEPRL